MTKIEKKIWDWICSHILELAVVLGSILSLLARYGMRDFVSRDMSSYLLPWFDEIKTGGIAALNHTVGNYNMPYQTLIALMTYIPIDPIYQYKILSSLFDLLQGIVVSKIVFLVTKDKLKTCITYIISILLPTILMNSSLWGQCDSIYTSFCLLTLLLMLEEKYTGAFVSFGIAFAFKFQAVFFLPFMLWAYVRQKRFSILNFLWIPTMMIILSLGGIIQEQSIWKIFSIYRDQLQFASMSVNYPSLWAVMIETYGRNNADYYIELHIFAIVMAVVVLMIIMSMILRSKKNDDLISVAFLSVYTCIIFLPNMHERYGYLYIVLGLVVAIIRYRMRLAYILLLIIDMMSYANYLFKMIPEWQVLGIINFGVYCYCAFCVIKPMFYEEMLDSDTSSIA